MSLLFCGMGGSGSTFLAQGLKRKFKLHDKPDTFIVRKGEPHTPKKEQKHQLVESLHEYPSLGLVQAFRSRSSFVMDESKSIEDNLLIYIKSIQANRHKTVLFNSIFKFSLFSKNRVAGVVFLVRHPLHGYISFTKKSRHFDLVADMGGRNSRVSAEYYARAWNDLVGEYVRTSDINHVIRYEYLDKDAAELGLHFLSKKWSKSVLLDCPVDRAVEEYLLSLVQDNFELVYGTNW